MESVREGWPSRRSREACFETDPAMEGGSSPLPSTNCHFGVWIGWLLNLCSQDRPFLGVFGAPTPKPKSYHLSPGLGGNSC